MPKSKMIAQPPSKTRIAPPLELEQEILHANAAMTSIKIIIKNIIPLTARLTSLSVLASDFILETQLLNCFLSSFLLKTDAFGASIVMGLAFSLNTIAVTKGVFSVSFSASRASVLVMVTAIKI